ncbi:hypothetical protein [Amycolatopsis sp. SID8362]|uniref:LVIVD repeat-containing protein n=1 Tax=Amycolatopsis sp. SID8362 TaxID=2690346 RepID=UPI00136F6F89|nr:hypothetical protein [Amycolatopsis sp. SID8362]NBH03475.1 hypothetical protein [Amycolatopsis sp. SID8362]NED40175.1 hypothetical protein [Amycolatopsis sp. SID8362]
MRRSRSVLLGSLFSLVMLGSSVPASAAPDDIRPPAGTVLDNFHLVGHAALDGFGDYGDIFAHGDFAYIGSRCSGTHQGGDGVQVVDISHPNRPRLVSKLPNPAYTRAEDVTVLDVRTPSFTGTLAVVGIQACFSSGHETEVVPGVRLFDVTDAVHPALLGQWDLPQGTVGCHEIDAVQRADGKVLVACARNLVDHRRSNGATALHLIDATNPRSPQKLTDWSLNLTTDQGVGCSAVQFAHSARFEDGGNSVYVSYWDAGTVHLDISQPATPAIVSDTKITPPDEDGDNHSMTLANNGKWLIINTEDTSPEDCPGESAYGGWGEVHVYDNTNPKQPTFLGTFSTGDSRSTRTDGEFTDHNTEVASGGQFFSSWYSGGIVWWTMNDHGVSAQRGQFVPPPNSDGSPASVWGVFIDKKHNVILGSDMTSGLWIVKPTRLDTL